MRVKIDHKEGLATKTTIDPVPGAKIEANKDILDKTEVEVDHAVNHGHEIVTEVVQQDHEHLGETIMLKDTITPKSINDNNKIKSLMCIEVSLALENLNNIVQTHQEYK